MGKPAKNDRSFKQIKTNQSLVHIKHSITIRQYKYWHLLLKSFSEQLENNVQPESDGFYYESRSKLEDYVGYELMSKEFKADIEALRKEAIVLNYLEKDGMPAIHGMGFISEYKITSNRIGFRLPSFIEQVIRGEDESNKLFLLLNWSIFNSFTGKYEAIIYKLCKDYVGVGKTPYFTVENYREYIGLNKDEYAQFNELNRWTIKKPILAINNNTISDIEVEVEFTKSGRSVIGLQFKVTSKKQNELPLEVTQSIQAFSTARISIPINTQTKYLSQYSEKQIAATIERANEYIDQLKANEKKINMGAIYNKALMENWGQQKLEELALKKLDEEKNKNELKRKKQLEKQEKATLDEKEKLHQYYIDCFNKLTSSKKEEVISRILEKNKSANPVFKILEKEYSKHGFDAYIHSPVFRGNLIAEMENILSSS